MIGGKDPSVLRSSIRARLTTPHPIVCGWRFGESQSYTHFHEKGKIDEATGHETAKVASEVLNVDAGNIGFCKRPL